MPKQISRPKTLRRPPTQEVAATPQPTARAEATVQFSRPNNLSLQGITGRQSQKPYVDVRHRDVHVIIPLASFQTGTARANFQTHNIIFGKPEWDNLVVDVNALTRIIHRTVCLGVASVA